MDDTLEYMKSNKGEMKMMHLGYMYTVHEKLPGGGLIWRCTRKNLHCEGSILTEKGNTKINFHHNHMPESYSATLARGQSDESPEFLEVDSEDCFEIAETDSSSSSQDQLQTQPKFKATGKSIPKTVQSAPVTPAVLNKPMEETHHQEICLKWTSYLNNMQVSLPKLLNDERFVDVMLVAEDHMLKCHKVILSSCSTFFESIFEKIDKNLYPVIHLSELSAWELKAVVDFMYVGQVTIAETKLNEFLNVASSLKIKGLPIKPKESLSSKPELPLDTRSSSSDSQRKSSSNTRSSPFDSERNSSSNTRLEGKKKPTLLKSCVKKTFISPEELPFSTDPLQLLKPVFVQTTIENEIPQETSKYQQSKKITKKRIRKRKSSEVVESISLSPEVPSQIRRGTRSRPNVRLPRYFNDDFETPLNWTTPSETKSKPPNFDFVSLAPSMLQMSPVKKDKNCNNLKKINAPAPLKRHTGKENQDKNKLHLIIHEENEENEEESGNGSRFGNLKTDDKSKNTEIDSDVEVIEVEVGPFFDVTQTGIVNVKKKISNGVAGEENNEGIFGGLRITNVLSLNESDFINVEENRLISCKPVIAGEENDLDKSLLED